MVASRKNYLLPAVRPGISKDYLPELPVYNFTQWAVGRGSVIWTVWPAVVVHSLFATLIVFLWKRAENPPEIPDIMLTVLGVVIGFVISYRAISGYERYWQGRTAWTEIITTARTLSRLIWVHVPPRLTPKTEEEIRTGEVKRSKTELTRIMAEKRMAIDLVKAFAYALKHHMRGELGYFYEDLYDLVKPLHDHDHELDEIISPGKNIRRPHRVTHDLRLPKSNSISSFHRPSFHRENTSRSSLILQHSASRTSFVESPPAREVSFGEDTVIDDNDSVHSGRQHRSRRPSPPSSRSPDERQPLLPNANAQEEVAKDDQVLDKAQADLIPFGGIFSRLFNLFSRKKKEDDRPDREHPALKSSRRWAGPVHSKIGRPKGSPRTTGTGENLPIEILRCLSEWFAVLEDRGTVPGTSLGSAMGCISTFEHSLSSLECILTTPLPFVYSAHIRQTVWIYLFLLPLQLVANFGYYTILGTAIATFIYLGFLAAGEEIEQPFGYDENDLDLDLFCREIIGDEIDTFKDAPSLHVWIPPQAPQGNPTGRPRPARRSTQSLVDSSKWETRNIDPDDSDY